MRTELRPGVSTYKSVIPGEGPDLSAAGRHGGDCGDKEQDKKDGQKDDRPGIRASGAVEDEDQRIVRRLDNPMSVQE